ncbi:recombinase family protein [Frankia sp. Cr1]|uniref:recombinase family protein n=1 Tax=Frankia sp. Cr1 TaxID=3073931 RepID=UPI002AD24026|nr:recombinase family protein [Frankia sp. Cr1]
MSRVAIYTRISEDPLALEKGIARQVEDCCDLAERHGWEIAGKYSDDDISALRGTFRPQYAALMAAVERGEVQIVVVYHTSRLWRNRRERAEGIELLATKACRVVAVKGQDLDLSTASGRGLTGILGELDTWESEIKSERVTRAALQRAQEGRANGACQFGWRRERTTDDRGRVLGFRDVEDPLTAAIVREIVDRLLRHESIKAITVDLNARNVPAPAAKQWLYSGVRKVALRPANIGLRTYKGEIIGPAAWPAIVDRDKHDQVVALLNDPARATSKSGARRHLLSFNAGIAACGVCGEELRVLKSHKLQLYTCNARKSCVGRNQKRVDDLVHWVLIERLSQPDAWVLFTRDDSSAHKAREEAETLRARLNTAADDYADGTITIMQLRRINARLLPQLEQAERAAQLAVPGVASELVGELIAAPEQCWNGLGITQQHAVLVALRMRIRILPTRRGPGFDHNSIEIKFLRADEVPSGKTVSAM